MGIDTGIFTQAELNAVDAHGVLMRDEVGEVTRVRPWWYATDDADPLVLAAVKAGGVASCVTAMAFHQKTVEQLWVPPDRRTHVRLSRHAKSVAPRRSGSVVHCQGYGRPLPTDNAVDSIPRALACAARCVPDDYWIAMCDSVIRFTDWTIPDLQAEMGVVSSHVRDLFAQCDPEAESGNESLTRVRLRKKGFNVRVQPVIGHRDQRADLRIGWLLIECDSEDHHSGEQRRLDICRDRKTLGAGWLTARIDSKEIIGRWDEVESDIRVLYQRQVWRIQPSAG